jgi:hypothetical protein
MQQCGGGLREGDYMMREGVQEETPDMEGQNPFMVCENIPHLSNPAHILITTRL